MIAGKVDIRIMRIEVAAEFATGPDPLIINDPNPTNGPSAFDDETS